MTESSNLRKLSLSVLLGVLGTSSDMVKESRSPLDSCFLYF